jgi:hypothetical protein
MPTGKFDWIEQRFKCYWIQKILIHFFDSVIIFEDMVIERMIPSTAAARHKKRNDRRLVRLESSVTSSVTPACSILGILVIKLKPKNGAGANKNPHFGLPDASMR